MSEVYRQLFDRLPRFLRRRIDPLEFAIESFVRSAARAPEGALVLDAGAGQARFAGFFGNHRYLALDSRTGDGSWDYSRLDLCGDLTAIPLRSQSVDVVLNTQVLEHLPDPGRALAEMRRVLKEGGFLYLTAPQGWPEHQQPHDYFRFTRWGLERLLTETGFYPDRNPAPGRLFSLPGPPFDLHSPDPFRRSPGSRAGPAAPLGADRPEPVLFPGSSCSAFTWTVSIEPASSRWDTSAAPGAVRAGRNRTPGWSRGRQVLPSPFVFVLFWALIGGDRLRREQLKQQMHAEGAMTSSTHGKR